MKGQAGDMKSGKEDQRSPFATALARLLDDTSLLTRQQWAELLDVSPAAISQWVNDKTIPRPEVLRMVIDVLEENSALTPQVLKLSWGQVGNLPRLEESSEPAPQVLEPSSGQPGNLPQVQESSALTAQILGQFKELTRRPSTEVSPNGERMGRSIGHYVVKPLLEGFLRNLDSLDFETQEQILYHASSACRQSQRNAEPGVGSPGFEQGSAERGVQNTDSDQIRSAQFEGLQNALRKPSMSSGEGVSMSATSDGLKGDGRRDRFPVAAERPADATLSTDGATPDDD